MDVFSIELPADIAAIYDKGIKGILIFLDINNQDESLVAKILDSPNQRGIIYYTGE